MRSRERILNTLNHQPVDHIPFDLGGTDCSSIHVLPYKALRSQLGFPIRPIKCGCMIQLIADLDNDVKDALGIDAEPLFFGSMENKIWKIPFGLDLIMPKKFDIEELPDGSIIAKNAQGKVYGKKAADSFYFDPVGVPLAGIDSVDKLNQFDTLFERWDYSYVYDESIGALAERAKEQYLSTDRAVVALWKLHYLQSGQLMRGYEQFLIDLMINKNMAHAILAKLHEAYLKRVDTFLHAFGDFFDIVFLADDLGSQESGLISPALYKEMIFPYVSEIVGNIKLFGKKVVMHSCGAVSEFIPFFIEMGVDALNPVQVSAKGMNPRNLVREYGKDITFWGGGCDTQHTLNASDTEVVRADVRRRLQEFTPEASFVFTQVHNIQYDIPVENIFAMRDEFWKQTRTK